MLSRIEYSVIVPVPAVAAFRAFCDLERLLHRGIYQEVSWIEGQPWQVGSRIRYVVSIPIHATILAVVTSYDPPRSVGILNHALGITTEQNASFVSDAKGGTRVRMTMEQSPSGGVDWFWLAPTEYIPNKNGRWSPHFRHTRAERPAILRQHNRLIPRFLK